MPIPISDRRNSILVLSFVEWARNGRAGKNERLPSMKLRAGPPRTLRILILR